MTHYFVDAKLNNFRIDKALAILINLSRNYGQKLIEQGHVNINNHVVSYFATKIKTGDIIEVIIPPVQNTDIVATNMDLDILYEDNDIIVINKPVGLVVHPGVGHYNDTLINGLLAHCGDNLSSVGGVNRPGILHRIDKDTSGLLLIAKNDYSYLFLVRHMQERLISRKYLALVWGIPRNQSGTIQTNIERHKVDHKRMQVTKIKGKNAVTHYKVNKILVPNKLSLLECKLDTGRTHQIRVHLSYIGHSILGDQVYGNNKRKIFSNFNDDYISNILLNFTRQALHAYHLSFIHPTTKECLEFTQKLPQDIASIIELFP